MSMTRMPLPPPGPIGCAARAQGADFADHFVAQDAGGGRMAAAVGEADYWWIDGLEIRYFGHQSSTASAIALWDARGCVLTGPVGLRRAGAVLG